MPQVAQVVVVVPVLGRPANVRPLAESLLESEGAVPLRLAFVCSPTDVETVHEVIAAGLAPLVAAWEPDAGDYARKVNLAYRKTSEPWLLLAADDVRFHPGWAERAVALGEEEKVGVVGTNDLGNALVMRGGHATHPLVARWYIDECGGSLDGPGVVYHEGYDHAYVDTELCGLAQSRGCYAHCHDAVVEHLHPFWGKGAPDATYAKGGRHGDRDARLFHQRRAAWA